MKKIIYWAFLIILLSACGSTSSQNITAQKNESLAVFCLGDLKDSAMMRLALDRYQEVYPDIKVELIKPEYDFGSFDLRDELYNHVAAQIMAGEGPDVFIVDDIIMDVEKLVRQGIFADMEPFFEEDQFNWEPYNKAVLDGGVWNGKRFIIPISYDFPLLVTSQTALKETGFNVDACKDYQGFLDETTRYMQDFSQTRQLFRNALSVTDVVEFSGISIADYDTKNVDLSSPLLYAGFQWYKAVMESCPTDYCDFHNDSALYGAAAIRNGDVLWTPALTGSFSNFFTNFAALKTIDEAVMMPIRDIEGGIQAKIRYPVAVRANSENLQNAYNYIKILLSFEVQSAIGLEELSVLNPANEFLYEKISQGKNHHIEAGVNGFTGTVNPNESIDWPTHEEFQQFVGFTQEITGTYYNNHLSPKAAMYSYVYENSDFQETLKTRRIKWKYIYRNKCILLIRCI